MDQIKIYNKMSGSLRQRHSHHSNSETHINEFNAVANKTHIYNPKSKSSVHKIAFWPLLLGVVLVVFLYSQLRSRPISTVSVQNNNLKLVTVYPWPIAATIHHIEGQTELLITKDNLEAVEAIRTSIAMANSLRRRRRYKSVLLRFTSLIASLGSQHSEKSDGDIELESYGETKIRQYLLEHGEKCSGDNEDIFQRYGELIDSIMSAGDDDGKISLLWDDAISLFTWCQFANEDARGYITHGTFLKSQQMLEESRIKGIGIIGADTALTDGMHYCQLFVVPRKKNDASREMSTEMLHSYLTASSPRDSSLDSPKPLLFGIHDGDLDQWASERWINTNGGLDGDWLQFK